MQAKDIPDRPVLEFLAGLNGRWGSMFSPEIAETSVFRAMPEETPFKVARAKMGSLIRRGLVDGCDCGCRGDFEITAKGREHLAKG